MYKRKLKPIERLNENMDLLNLVVGALLTSFATVVGYFYGSSAGSAAKNEMLTGKKNE